MVKVGVRLTRGLVGAAVLAAVFCVFGVDAAFAGSCNPGSTNFNFTLGATNTCDSGFSTYLVGDTSPNGLFVELKGGGANTRPIIGYASGAFPAAGSIGVSGSTNSTGSYSAGVAGALNDSNPAADAAGVRGVGYSTTANGAGVWGNHQPASGTAPGVLGDTGSTTASAVGVQGLIIPTNPGASSAAVRGTNNGTGGLGIGVEGFHAGSGYGVYGHTPRGFGVVGLHASASGTAPGVWGETNSTAAGAFGVLGDISTTSSGASAAGVRGINNGTGSLGIGVWGSHAGSGYGVYGFAPSGFGVVGESNTGWAGFFNGNVRVNGTLSKSAGGFTIDHPLDPAHKYLSHSFVESPDMKDVYDGVVVTDRRGFAVVRLPRYFQVLNRSFRYQLTIVGRSFAQAIVWKEIAHNSFTVRTNQPRVKVSWQVTGIRHDPYANAHRIKVVEEKPAADQGKYLQPQLYGMPRSKSEVPAPRSGPARKVMPAVR
jgi:hypothetical protein